MTNPGKGKNKKVHRANSSGILILHNMVIEENFERCAYRLHEMVKSAQAKFPGARRSLFIMIDGHCNELGGFDRDACEIVSHFIPKYLMEYLTECTTPFHTIENNKKQINEIPDKLIITPPPEDDASYDVHGLALRSREEESSRRNSPPSVKMICDYIGMDPPRCLICKGTPVERAHAVPKSLGGSYDVRNFALLCPEHHRQAPDIADAESFWAWVDYMGMGSSLGRKAVKHPKMLGIRLPSIDGSDGSNVEFAEAVQRELIELYGWTNDDFDSVTWAVNIELHKVLERATGYHFGVVRKSSTYAWAYDVALRRTGKERRPYFPIY